MLQAGHEKYVSHIVERTVQTNRTIPNNQPDITIHVNKQETCMLLDAAMPGEKEVIKRGAERILKYKDCMTEIERMWTVNTKVIPVIIGATGTV